MLWKCCTQYVSKFGKFSCGPRTPKCQFSLQSQINVISLSVQTTAQLHSSHMLAKWCSKFSKPGFNGMWSMNFQMFKLDKGRGTMFQVANICWIIKKARVPKKHILLLYWLGQNLWLCDSQQTMKNSSRDGNTRLADLPLEKSVCRLRRNN